MKTKFISMVTGIALAAGSAASFGYSNDSNYDYARVTDVEPITKTVRISTPHQECWNETVAVHNRAGGRSYTGEILGGIIGAAVGHQFGSGRGQDVATVAGAILGGSVGRDIKNRTKNRGYYQNDGYETVERCETVNDYRTEERVMGYNVTYQYNNETYTTRMDHDPGDSIKVRVHVSPVH